MSIEQKIAQLVAEGKELQEDQTTEEVVAEETITESADYHEKMADQHANHANQHEKEASNDGHPDHDYASVAHADAEKAHNAAAAAHKKHGADSSEYKKASQVAASATNNAKSESEGLRFRKVSKPKAIKEETEEVTDEVTAGLTVDVSEDVAALVNGEELSEEFKTKAATIFEAAVVTRVKSEMAKLEEQFEVQLEEQVEAIKEGLVEKVDGYLNYVVEQWMTDNEIALENGMKNEILESFVSGMKGLFEQHYIDVPEEKFDVLGQMQEEVETLKSKLDEQLAISVELNGMVNAMTRESSIAESAQDLSDLDAEKFRGLAEELAFDDAESFAAKLQTIKESYFGAKKQSAAVQSVVSDEPVVEELTEEKKIDPVMAGYLRAFKS